LLELNPTFGGRRAEAATELVQNLPIEHPTITLSGLP
jgi:hypothetical protein